MKFIAEYTDTFGGEANYSWVKRERFEAPNDASNAMLMRRAKKALGLTNVRGRTNSYGDTVEFRPYNMCQIVFVFEDTCRADEEYHAIPADLPY